MIMGNLLKSLTLTAFLPVATVAAELPPLSENQRIVSEFLAAAVGDEIRKNCPTIHARFFRVLRKANELENYALSLGYTEDDIRAFRKNEDNKALLRQMRDDYLSDNGVTPEVAEDYCRLGRQEMANETLIGSLLWGG
ncbi:DUF5333 domain-containing protein [Defluviimonas sp. WL0002]|uniref:DUF5333 domain-containing protein n=1 Tax=Albidovulum marisflavi TaxID=2984159 RepID=A0ABT2ZF75_9RHOB|nr:DUF5333 domain-containing protein [Defluviimonas sp. WL0002]MCV2869790.1 DUF5333 domain-containing protein [Defluviimonas sp. WL0002]